MDWGKRACGLGEKPCGLGIGCVDSAEGEALESVREPGGADEGLG